MNYRLGDLGKKRTMTSCENLNLCQSREGEPINHVMCSEAPQSEKDRFSQNGVQSLVKKEWEAFLVVLFFMDEFMIPSRDFHP